MSLHCTKNSFFYLLQKQCYHKNLHKVGLHADVQTTRKEADLPYSSRPFIVLMLASEIRDSLSLHCASQQLSFFLRNKKRSTTETAPWSILVRYPQLPKSGHRGIDTVALRYIQLFAIWCSTNSLPSCILKPSNTRPYHLQISLQSQTSVRQHLSATLLSSVT